MAKTMTASQQKPMTDGQIDAVANKLRDALRKHRSEISSEVAQQVNGIDNLGMLLYAPYRERAEALSKVIVRHVKVDRTLEPQTILDATNRTPYTDRSVVDSMPRGEGNEVEVHFFPLEKGMTEEEFALALDQRGLKPDPIAQTQVNTDDPAFADKCPNGTQWKDADGKNCFATFYRWLGKRRVGVNRDDGDGWSSRWWGCGVRK